MDSDSDIDIDTNEFVSDEKREQSQKLLNKVDLLRKLHELIIFKTYCSGSIENKYTMKSDYDEILNEYERQKQIIEDKHYAEIKENLINNCKDVVIQLAEQLKSDFTIEKLRKETEKELKYINEMENEQVKLFFKKFSENMFEALDSSRDSQALSLETVDLLLTKCKSYLISMTIEDFKYLRNFSDEFSDKTI